MRVRFSAALALTLVLAACDDVSDLDIRVLQQAGTAAQTPFEQAYQGGKAHLLAGRNGLAIVLFERALAIDGSSVAALNGAGAAYDGLGRPDIAARYYAAALAIEPAAADTLNNMAVSALKAGRTEEAAVLFRRAAALAPQNGTIEVNLGLFDRGPAIRLSWPSAPDEDATRPHLRRAGLNRFDLDLPFAPNGAGIRAGMDERWMKGA